MEWQQITCSASVPPDQWPGTMNDVSSSQLCSASCQAQRGRRPRTTPPLLSSVGCWTQLGTLSQVSPGLPAAGDECPRQCLPRVAWTPGGRRRSRGLGLTREHSAWGHHQDPTEDRTSVRTRWVSHQKTEADITPMEALSGSRGTWSFVARVKPGLP